MAAAAAEQGRLATGAGEARRGVLRGCHGSVQVGVAAPLLSRREVGAVTSCGGCEGRTGDPQPCHGG